MEWSTPQISFAWSAAEPWPIEDQSTTTARGTQVKKSGGIRKGKISQIKGFLPQEGPKSGGIGANSDRPNGCVFPKTKQAFWGFVVLLAMASRILPWFLVPDACAFFGKVIVPIVPEWGIGPATRTPRVRIFRSLPDFGVRTC